VTRDSSGLSTSDSLLSRARCREEAAWSRLVELYGPLVSHWVRTAGLGEGDAADVVQEVFRAAMGGIDRFRRDRRGDSFRAWLRVIARSKTADHFRRRAREPEYGTESVLERGAAGAAGAHLEEEDTTEGEGETPVERALVDELLRAALESVRARVKPHTYEAFSRTVLDGRPPADVAEELGMTAGAVRVAKTRVLQRLRAELGELE